jgi:multidrug efflux pump subunit AcrA (membrane-fusion protein)
MTRGRKRLLGIAAVVVIILVIFFRTNESDVRFESVTVVRGDLDDVRREVGVLQSYDPELLTADFNCELKWIMDDGIWVNKGDVVFYVDTEKIIESLNSKQEQLIVNRQELRLQELRRQRTLENEQRKVKDAQRKYELTKVKFRILTATPKAGRELIVLHKKLLPLEKELKDKRWAFEKSLEHYLDVHDSALIYEDEYENLKTQMLMLQGKMNQFELLKKKDVSLMQPSQAEDHAKKLSKLNMAEGEMNELLKRMPTLRKKMVDSQAEENTLRGPLETKQNELEAAEKKSEELYIQLEIEKGAIDLAKLQLDVEITELTLKEAKQKHLASIKAYEQGAISKSDLEKAESEFIKQKNTVSILNKRIEIERRPPDASAIQEARIDLEKRKKDADNAQKRFERELKINDAEIKLKALTIARLEKEIAFRSREFPELCEMTISNLEKELKLIDPDDAKRRKEIADSLKEKRAALEKALENPPHIYKAPVSGVVRIASRGRGGAKAKVGDEFWEQDLIAQIFPPDRIEVVSYINEVNIRNVKTGMPAKISFPSLDQTPIDAEISELSAMGKDKFDDPKRFAGVTQFEVRLKMSNASEAFRQGMTVNIDIFLRNERNVLWLPQAAVHERDGAFYVYDHKSDEPEHEVQGRLFGSDYFIVDGGLDEEDRVWIRRQENY